MRDGDEEDDVLSSSKKSLCLSSLSGQIAGCQFFNAWASSGPAVTNHRKHITILGGIIQDD